MSVCVIVVEHGHNKEGDHHESTIRNCRSIKPMVLQILVWHLFLISIMLLCIKEKK